jgi:hypothetical protein
LFVYEKSFRSLLKEGIWKEQTQIITQNKQGNLIVHLNLVLFIIDDFFFKNNKTIPRDQLIGTTITF